MAIDATAGWMEERVVPVYMLGEMHCFCFTFSLFSLSILGDL